MCPCVNCLIYIYIIIIIYIQVDYECIQIETQWCDMYTYTYIYIYSKKMFCLSIGKNGGAPPDLAAAFWETKPRMRSSCKHGRLIVGNQIAHHCAIVSGVVSVHVVGNLGQPDTELFRIPSHKRAPTSWEAWHLLLMYDDVLFWLVQSGPPRQTNWLETL
jgi:hypothetical protein